MLLKPPRTAPAPPHPSRVPPPYPVSTVSAGTDAPPAAPGNAFDDTTPIPMVPLPVAALRTAPPRRRGLALIPLRAGLSGAAVAAAVVTALRRCQTSTPPCPSRPAAGARPQAGRPRRARPRRRLRRYPSHRPRLPRLRRPPPHHPSRVTAGASTCSASGCAPACSRTGGRAAAQVSATEAARTWSRPAGRGCPRSRPARRR
jgi:hypothetical protein